jgi:hypothetical protein
MATARRILYPSMSPAQVIDAINEASIQHVDVVFEGQVCPEAQRAIDLAFIVQDREFGHAPYEH